MQRTLSILTTAGVALGLSTTAMAAWDRIGSVEFSRRVDHETQYGNFGGGVEKLALQARNVEVRCRDIKATFGNGNIRSVFQGTLPAGRTVTIDLPGDDRVIRRLDFSCRSTGRRDATVDISADIGRYQAEWRKSPDWDRMWSRMFSWANVPSVDYDRPPRGWEMLSSEHFEGRRDRESTVPGVRGRNVEKVGLRATDTDARCRSLVATFVNGKSRRFEVNGGDPMRQGRVYQIDLPGDERNIARLDLNCQALGERNVTIQVMANGRDLPPLRNEWTLLGSEHFEGRRDRETTIGGSNGRRIERLGLRPTDNDARCQRVDVTFANGKSQNLNVNGGGTLTRNRIYQIDLPGDDRNVERVNLVCQAERGRNVTIDVLAADSDRN